MASLPHAPWLHRFAVLTAAATFLLIWVGGLVTSHGAGMAVPDWPTTYGYNMFFFPFSGWVGGIFYEHSHRLVGSAVGLLTVVLAVWLWIKDSRRWLRWLGLIALFAVTFQGVLGGLRVIQMNDVIGVFHATLAQLIFCLLVAIALFTSNWWREGGARRLRRFSVRTDTNSRLLSTLGTPKRPEGRTPGATPGSVRHDGAPKMSIYVTSGLRYSFALVSGLILLQLILGASMRHQHAGLAIPDFPSAYGKLWPDTDAAAVAKYNQARGEVTATNPITAVQIHLQMTHRFVAVLILVSIAWVVERAKRLHAGTVLSKLSMAWLGIILLQALLGAVTIWTNKAADIATLHVAVGALSLMTGVLLTLMSFRLRFLANSASAPTSAQPANFIHQPDGVAV